MAYRLTRNAQDDLIGLYGWSIAEFGIVQAERYRRGLEEAFAFLSEFPLAARERAGVAPSVRAHPYKSHLIVYLLEGEGILIVGIRHGREDWINDPNLTADA